MANLLPLKPQSKAVDSRARVMEALGDRLVLNCHGQRLNARRAASCLLAPEAGDLVLLDHQEGRECFVLAVLERSAGTPAKLEMQGDMLLSLPSGGLEVSVRDELSLFSDQALDLAAPRLGLKAKEGEVNLGNLNLAAKLVVWQADRVRGLARALDLAASRISQWAKTRFSQIDELDHLEAGAISQEARGVLNVRGRCTIVSAEKELKADGETVLIG